MTISEKIAKVEAGESCPLELLAEFKMAQKEIESALEKIMPYAIKKFNLYGEKSVKTAGAIFTLAQSGRYIYDNNSDYRAARERLKRIESNMQIAAKTGQDYIDMETGEVFPPAEYKSNNPSIAVKL